MTPTPKIPDSEITPPALYLNRRQFIRGVVLAGSVMVTGGVYRALTAKTVTLVETPELADLIQREGSAANGFRVDEPMTSRQDITHYNNFYEFTTEKEGVASTSTGFSAKDWKLSVEGLVRNPRVFGLDEFRSISPPEERVYRMRCVEAWSMV